MYLFSTTEAYQFLKLPIVFEHFSEHRKLDGNITFASFLAMHYLHGCPKDADYDRDMQLPFKTSASCISSMPQYVPLIEAISISEPAKAPQKEKSYTADQFILSHYLSIIWQPPRSSQSYIFI